MHVAAPSSGPTIVRVSPLSTTPIKSVHDDDPEKLRNLWQISLEMVDIILSQMLGWIVSEYHVATRDPHVAGKISSVIDCNETHIAMTLSVLVFFARLRGSYRGNTGVRAYCTTHHSFSSLEGVDHGGRV